MLSFRKPFRDRIVVVTGGGSGIGRATAFAFAARGAAVHVVDLHATRAEAVAASIKADGGWACAHEVDVRDAEALEALAATVYEEHGRCDVLVNNAGVAHGGLVHETSLEDWRWVLETNLWGVIHGVHAFVPRMIDQGGDASIVNLASIAGLIGVPSMVPYCASKFAVVGMSEGLGAELSPYGIHVAVVCPGVTDTDIVRAARIEGAMGGQKSRLVKLGQAQGIAPERVARDIVRAVRTRAPLRRVLGAEYPMLLLKRLSPRAYRAAAGFALGRLLGASR